MPGRRRCINGDCRSKPKRKLFAAQKSVCNYYNVFYTPDRKVCMVCMQKCIVYLEKIGRRFKNGQCILDDTHPTKPVHVIELSDSDDDDAVNNVTKPSTENLDPQIAKLRTTLNTILEDTVGPLFEKQEELCEIYLASQKAEIDADNKRLEKLSEKVDRALRQLYNKLYKFDDQRKFEFDKEIRVFDHFNDDVELIASKTLPILPNDLPKEGQLKRHLLTVGDRVYGMKHSQLHPWIEGTIKSAINSTWGVIAEPPKYLNNFRYMIFFDDGHAQYVYHKNIRLVCGESPNVSDDVHENIREFVKAYLHKYPERLMVKFNKKQVVHTKLNNFWRSAKVKNLDASLVQLKFLDMKIKHTEWIYRGSNRLGPIYNQLSNQDKRVRGMVLTDVNKLLNRPYIEIDLTDDEKSVNIDNSDNTQKPHENNGVIKSIEIPANCPKPLPYKHHECSYFCMSWVEYNYSKTKYMTFLSIPLHFGFTRSVLTDKKLKLKKVIYTTPCGRNIDNENEMYNYLKLTSYAYQKCLFVYKTYLMKRSLNRLVFSTV
eukprot:XP_016661125.1 PREDICTED: histone-lysine N-methyltransferase eggless-like [Acyrthosiphon pisum]